jgi:hypothetical protein
LEFSLSHVEANRLGDRLAQLGGIADFLRGLDPAKINEIVTQLIAFLKVILGLFGQPTPTVSALSTEECEAAGAIFTTEQVQANAIDLGAIMALVQLIMQLLAMFRKPAATT